MGNSQNQQVVSLGIKQYMEQEFNKVKKDQKRKYLTISQVLQIKHPQDYSFDFKHLGNLYVCDSTLDGIFTLNDFEKFIIWIQNNLQNVQMYQFRSQLQSRTVSMLIQKLQKKDGQNTIISWFLKMLLEDSTKRRIQNQTYIKIENIKTIYEIFNVRIMNDMDIQSFFYLIKRSAEDMGYPIQQVTQHDQDQQYIAIAVCQEFIRGFLKGALKILKDVGYNHTIS